MTSEADPTLDINDSNLRIITHSSNTDKLKALFAREKYVFWGLLLGLLLILSFFFLSKKSETVQPEPPKIKPWALPEYVGAPLPVNYFLTCPVHSPKSLVESAATDVSCRWVFDFYESSQYESLWLSNIKEWQKESCKRLAEPEHLKRSQEIVSQILTLKNIDPSLTWSTVDSWAQSTLKGNYDSMSKFYYKRECYNNAKQIWEQAKGKGIQLIEPLWGYLRDPFDGNCQLTANKLTGWEGDAGQSKEHILPLGFAPYAYTLQDGEIDGDQWHTHGIPPWKKKCSSKPTLNSRKTQ
jgi:hypothetical protein